MGITKTRPRLHFSTFGEVCPGDTLEGVLNVSAEESVEIDWLKIEFTGTERAWRKITGDSKSVSLVRLGLTLFGKTRIEPGRHQFPFKIDLPSGIPPTFQSSCATTLYALTARASIPWWPDARHSTQVLVATAWPAAKHPGAPILLTTSKDGPRGTEPYCEVSLAQGVFAPGDVVRGAISVRNVTHHRYRKLVFELERQLLIDLGSRKHLDTETPARWEVDISGATENEQVPFSLTLGEPLEPTFASLLWRTQWTLKIRLDVAWKLDPKLALDVPMVEVRHRARALATAPSVGAPRVSAFWGEVASASGLELLGSAMRGHRGATTAAVWREETKGGEEVRGRLSYPSLGLGLAITPRRPAIFVDDSSIAIGDRKWDRNHSVIGREDEQSIAFLTTLKPWLTAFPRVTMSDTELVVSAAKRINRSAALAAFVKPLVELAERIEATRATIGPPAAAAAMLPAWRALAETLDGEVNAANLSIAGRFHGHPVAVAASWNVDGTPSEIVCELELARDLDAALEVGITPTLEPKLPDAFSIHAVELVASLAGLASRLEIRGDTLAATCQWLAQPQHVLGVLRTLAELAATLSGEGGAYR